MPSQYLRITTYPSSQKRIIYNLQEMWHDIFLLKAKSLKKEYKRFVLFVQVNGLFTICRTIQLIVFCA